MSDDADISGGSEDRFLAAEYALGLLTPAEHATVVGRLAPSSRRWAPSASLLVVNIAHRTVDDTDLEFSEFADYDLGQAVAHMTIQAQALGLASRQFRAFDLRGLTADLDLTPGWQVRSMTAIGRAVGAAPARERRSLADLRHEQRERLVRALAL